jgi:DNA-binding HxlR family transcriptional regulator
VDYELTALGHSLRVPVQELGNWAFENIDVVAKARAVFDARGDRE